MVILMCYAGALLEPNGLANALDKLMKTKLVTKNQKAALRNARAEVSSELASNIERPCHVCHTIHSVFYYVHYQDGWLVDHCRATRLHNRILSTNEAAADLRNALAELKKQKSKLSDIKARKAIDAEIARLDAELEPYRRKIARLEEQYNDAILPILKLEHDAYLEREQARVKDRYEYSR